MKKDKSINPNSKAIELLAVGLDLLEGKKGERGEKGETGEQGPAGKDSTVPGPKGDKGDTGPKGADGKDGKPGKDGKDGKDGKQGPKGDKGDTGPQGPKGEDAQPVTPDVILDVTTPIIIQNVQKAVASKTASLSELDDVDLTQATITNGKYVIGGGTGSIADTFETVSQNLNTYPFTYNYTGDFITSIDYTTPTGTITKTIAYTGDLLTSITLSGDTPESILLTKTITYSGSTPTGVTYS